MVLVECNNLWMQSGVFCRFSGASCPVHINQFSTVLVLIKITLENGWIETC